MCSECSVIGCTRVTRQLHVSEPHEGGLHGVIDGIPIAYADVICVLCLYVCLFVCLFCLVGLGPNFRFIVRYKSICVTTRHCALCDEVDISTPQHLQPEKSVGVGIEKRESKVQYKVDF